MLTCRDTYDNPSAWYEPGAGSSDSWSSAPADAASPDAWTGAADSVPSGRFSAGGDGAAVGKAAAGAAAGQHTADDDAEEADESSAVRFLDEESDGALFLNRDGTWHAAGGSGDGDAPAAIGSLQAQLPDWGAAAAGSGFGASDSSGGSGGGGSPAADVPLEQSGAPAEGGSGFDAVDTYAAAPDLQQPAPLTAEEVADQMRLMNNGEPSQPDLQSYEFDEDIDYDSYLQVCIWLLVPV